MEFYSDITQQCSRAGRSWDLHCGQFDVFLGPRKGVCVCVKMKKRVPDEWQALQAKIAKRNEKKSTEKEEAHFVSRVTVILTREKERDYPLNLHMSQSTCFGT